MLRVRGLRFSYGTRRFRLDVPELDLQPGALNALVGPNGAGKTTLLRLLSGLLTPRGGTASIDDRPVEEWLTRHRISAALDDFPPDSNLSLRDWLTVLGRVHRWPRSDGTRLAEFAREWGVESLLHRPLRDCSAGQRRQLALAMAMPGDWDLLLLDEPFATLDPDATAAWRARIASLARRGKTIVVSSHSLPELERLASRFFFLRDGRIRRVATAKELSAQARIHAVLRCPREQIFRILRSDAILQLTSDAPGVHSLLVDAGAVGHLSGLMTTLVREGVTVETVETRERSLEEVYEEVSRG